MSISFGHQLRYRDTIFINLVSKFVRATWHNRIMFLESEKKADL